MTDTDIDAMDAGAACDMAVGEAIGLPLQGNNRDGVSLVLGDDESVKFQPSRFWNDAMYAAGRCGLFDVNGHWASLMQFSAEGAWHVQNAEDMRGVVAQAPTGPLAISRAILKLARKEDQ